MTRITTGAGVDWANATGARLYRHARTRIPGGTQLLSKRPEMFLPELWPAYYSRARGCECWDLDGRRFLDMTTGAIGACLLGFADPDVDAAVKACIDRGTMCTLNPPVEVELADLLCEIHPWAEMVRFTRTGGESMAVAVRIARAYTGRDRILVCGYHGWHDWYLAANLSDDRALDGHLLPGLQPTGVPRALLRTAMPFHFNKAEELEALAATHGTEIAAIVMEPVRFDLPAPGFLERVRTTADHVGAVLIFDEITAGWRHHFGGAHRFLGVSPDVAVFAKSMSNGYPMGAVIGRRNVMQAAQQSFISSTYWTEAIGPTAALATIRKMQAVDLAAHTRRIGQQVQEGWRYLGEKHGLGVKVEGLPALTHFSIDCGDRFQALRTLLTQYMLDRGFLATNTFYATLGQDDGIVAQYLSALDEVFGLLRQALDADDIEKRLKGPVAHSGFRRLT